MTIDYESLMQRAFPVARQAYGPRDCLIYALGVGLGYQPTDARQLTFATEERLRPFPTMASVLAYPGLWIREPDTGIDWENALHAEQGMAFLAPLPTEAVIEAQTKVVGIVDKGPGRGALIYTERTGVDANTGAAYFTVSHTTFARNDGGYGGPSDPARAPEQIPERKPDTAIDLPTTPQQALLFRLNGDPNPHNAFPESAAAAGFPRPILHGLCAYGLAGHAILAACGDYDPEGLRSLDVRLAAPLYPGETLRTDIWVEPDMERVLFRSTAIERDVVVLNNGCARLRKL